MKKKFIVALATSLLVANAAPVAFAAEVSNTNDTTTTTTVPAAGTEARDAYKGKREAILDAFRTAMESAKNAFEKARELATTDEARNAAVVARQVAVSTATQVKIDALKALGPKPEKLGLTTEQIAIIAKYRLDMTAFEAARSAYRDKREVIRDAFKTAKENAKDAFKTARELATTNEARKAAAVAFKAAVNVARQAHEVALTALGDSPEKPAKPNFGN